jgi:hypothetical protein
LSPRPSHLNYLHFYLWRRLKTLAYAALVDNEEALNHRIVDACQTTRNYPGNFERTRRSMLRRVDVCIESRGGQFEPLI